MHCVHGVGRRGGESGVTAFLERLEAAVVWEGAEVVEGGAAAINVGGGAGEVSDTSDGADGGWSGGWGGEVVGEEGELRVDVEWCSGGGSLPCPGMIGLGIGIYR